MGKVCRKRRFRCYGVPAKPRLQAIAMLSFALLFAAVTTAVPAQTTPPETQRALNSLSSLGAAIGSDLPRSQPVTAGVLSQARTYIERMGFHRSIDAGVQLRRSLLLRQIDPGGKLLPAASRAALERDVAAAFDVAAVHYVSGQLAYASTWFAERLTPDELSAGIEFLSQDLGAKMAGNAAGLTPAEREAIGRYIMDHPAMTRVTAANVQFGRDTLARRAVTTAAFDADVKSGLCPRLAADKIQLPSCTAVTR